MPNSKFKKTTSEVWQHFSLSADGKTIQCKLCPGTKLAYKGSTSVMWTHMKARHPSVAMNESQGMNKKTRQKIQSSLHDFNLSKKMLTPARLV